MSSWQGGFSVEAFGILTEALRCAEDSSNYALRSELTAPRSNPRAMKSVIMRDVEPLCSGHGGIKGSPIFKGFKIRSLLNATTHDATTHGTALNLAGR